MSESLNLEENRNILIKKALLKYKTYREAAAALGCSEKLVMNKSKDFKNTIIGKKHLLNNKNLNL